MAGKNRGKTPGFAAPLSLAVLLVVLGGVTYWLQFKKAPRDEAAKADSKKVLRVKGSAIERFEVHGASVKPGKEKKPPLDVVLRCESLADRLCKTDDVSKWKLVSPLQTKADDTTVNSLLKNLGNLVADDSVDLTKETPEKRSSLLKDYGLDSESRKDPKIRRIVVARSGGPTTTVYFGAKSPIGDSTFALVQTGDSPDESKVDVVPGWQLSVFDQKTSYFRDKNLFSGSEKDVDSFSMTSKKTKGAVEGKRSAEGKSGSDGAWSIRNGSIEAEGDRDSVDELLSGVVRLSAKDIVSDRRDSSESRKALSGAKLVYDFKFESKGKKERLRLYEKKKDPKSTVTTVYAVAEGQDPLYEIDSYSAEKIEKTFDELRVGKLIGVADRYSIDEIDVDAHGAENFTQHLEKKGTRWKVGELDSAPGAVEKILDRLSSKIVVAYSGPDPIGDFVKMTFRKGDAGKKTTVAEIEFWSTKGRLYARNLRSPKKEIVELAQDFKSSLPFQSATLTGAKRNSGKK